MTQSKNPHRLFAAFLFTLLLAGCTTIRYEYFPPATEQGRYCTTQCSAIKDNCEGNEINRANGERYACEQLSEYQYRDCLHHARNDGEAKKCYRQGCYSSPNTWRCEENYRQCFVGCGGTIHTIKEE
jgi:hypothetical protein